MSLVDNDKMLDYIHEEQKYALHIYDNAEKICEEFANNYAVKSYGRILLVASGTSNNA